MKLSKAIEGYCISKRADGFSQNTINGYQNHFAQLVEFTDDKEIQQVTSYY